MTDQLSRTIATCAIWLATAVILTFGLFRMTGETFFFLIATLVISGAALGATAVVWYAASRGPNEAPPPTETANHLSDEHEHGITTRPRG